MSEPTNDQLTAGLLMLEKALNGRWARWQMVRAIWRAMQEAA